MGLSQDILDFNDLRTKEVEVPAWKRSVTIRELSWEDSTLLIGLESITETGKISVDTAVAALIVARGVIDPENQERVFSDEQAPELAKKNIGAIKILCQEIVSLSGSVEEAEKN